MNNKNLRDRRSQKNLSLHLKSRKIVVTMQKIVKFYVKKYFCDELTDADQIPNISDDFMFKLFIFFAVHPTT